MRGENVLPALGPSEALRFIPACAGKTSTSNPIQMRLNRFIPACAGKTSIAISPYSPQSVHPRMRGENNRRIPISRMLDGSSPHARGKHKSLNPQYGEMRFIPACAGKTTGSPVYNLIWAVHPRMRGENVLGRYAQLPMYGSSPHARGKLRPHFSRKTRTRFIPACAGKTRPYLMLLSVPAVHPRMRGENSSSRPIL